MPSETRLSNNNSTIVPAEVRKRFDITPGHILVWEVKNGMIEVLPQKKVTFDAIVGIIDVGGDAVAAKRRIQAGRKA